MYGRQEVAFSQLGRILYNARTPSSLTALVPAGWNSNGLGKEVAGWGKIPTGAALFVVEDGPNASGSGEKGAEAQTWAFTFTDAI